MMALKGVRVSWCFFSFQFEGKEEMRGCDIADTEDREGKDA